ncbi:phosphoribosylglycinamideformyltransferase [Monoraphidium neglectum]|uniref:phosphoribosylglycinamide formyltransferase 1 n=1 Tax=Monoraphidium neglectum TaxID=145388 RepID=A0A0D2KDK0_9CHLO|nr:phosphoribosylglycinamideformyltransferase [Monoraphidium neglectum]KIY93908.1 phosphoribosylglycinamideformyltransferase [Monoraphidium neglectum]|eukprot:XP_013892928.1 phosphoribosylglycinamideformyltransferase [Monoraphidium neglectum]
MDGRINAEVVAVVSDVPTCGGVQYAQSHGIPTLTYPIPKKGGFPGLTTEQLVEALTQQLGAEYVLLAGFLKVRVVGGGSKLQMRRPL